MMVRVSLLLIYVAVTAATGVKPTRAASKGTKLLRTRSATSPALQPHDTFDEDYPIDNANLTPSQLRYKAQADYAKAVAAMKEEESEAIDAKALADAELKKYHVAVEAARNAKLKA